MEQYNIHQQIRFTSGMYRLNDEPNFNYQLNRVIHWNGGTLEDVRRIAPNIHNSADWKRQGHGRRTHAECDCLLPHERVFHGGRRPG